VGLVFNWVTDSQWHVEAPEGVGVHISDPGSLKEKTHKVIIVLAPSVENVQKAMSCMQTA